MRRMLIAALTSRSCSEPQLPQIQERTDNGISSAFSPQHEHALRRMMLTGYRVPAPELFRLAIVEACVPRVALMERVMNLAHEIAAKSPAAIRLAKGALNAIEDMSLRDGYRHEQDLTAQLSEHPDAKEAAEAFLAKRKPVFRD